MDCWPVHGSRPGYDVFHIVQIHKSRFKVVFVTISAERTIEWDPSLCGAVLEKLDTELADIGESPSYIVEIFYVVPELHVSRSELEYPNDCCELTKWDSRWTAESMKSMIRIVGLGNTDVFARPARDR